MIVLWIGLLINWYWLITAWANQCEYLQQQLSLADWQLSGESVWHLSFSQMFMKWWLAKTQWLFSPLSFLYLKIHFKSPRWLRYAIARLFGSLKWFEGWAIAYVILFTSVWGLSFGFKHWLIYLILTSLAAWQLYRTSQFYQHDYWSWLKKIDNDLFLRHYTVKDHGHRFDLNFKPDYRHISVRIPIINRPKYVKSLADLSPMTCCYRIRDANLPKWMILPAHCGGRLWVVKPQKVARSRQQVEYRTMGAACWLRPIDYIDHVHETRNQTARRKANVAGSSASRPNRKVRVDRTHLIAHCFCNLENAPGLMFMGTHVMNTGMYVNSQGQRVAENSMLYYENLVRHYLLDEQKTIFYQAIPVYQSDKDLIPVKIQIAIYMDCYPAKPTLLKRGVVDNRFDLFGESRYRFNYRTGDVLSN